MRDPHGKGGHGVYIGPFQLGQLSEIENLGDHLMVMLDSHEDLMVYALPVFTLGHAGAGLLQPNFLEEEVSHLVWAIEIDEVAGELSHLLCDLFHITSQGHRHPLEMVKVHPHPNGHAVDDVGAGVMVEKGDVTEAWAWSIWPQVAHPPITSLGFHEWNW
jgi:hypothetical protein